MIMGFGEADIDRALACREDVALPVAGTGVYALWHVWRTT